MNYDNNRRFTERRREEMLWRYVDEGCRIGVDEKTVKNLTAKTLHPVNPYRVWAGRVLKFASAVERYAYNFFLIKLYIFSPSCWPYSLTNER